MFYFNMKLMQKYLIPRCHLVVKNPSANTGDIRDTSSIPASGRSRGGAQSNPLQYSCLENPWTEEPGRLQFIGLWRVGHDWSDLAHMHTIQKYVIPVYLCHIHYSITMTAYFIKRMTFEALKQSTLETLLWNLKKKINKSRSWSERAGKTGSIAK